MFKVGEIVQICADLNGRRSYNGFTCRPAMLLQKGKLSRITKIIPHDPYNTNTVFYRLAILLDCRQSIYYWTEDMLQQVQPSISIF